MNINPKLTQEFVKDLQSKNSVYRVNVDFKGESIPIDVYPTVFPPKSDYSVSSKTLYTNLGNLKNKKVLDIGCGSGIESIIAAKLGAKKVDAVDVNDIAIDCTEHNIRLNSLEDIVSAFFSDIFSNIHSKDYDVVIANLPIVNFDAEDNRINNALYDNNFELHRRLFEEVGDYMKEDGFLTFTHANLQSMGSDNPLEDFEDIEELISKYNLEIMDKVSYEDMGYNWVNYKIKTK